MMSLKDVDSEIFSLTQKELERQTFVLNMIPSENYVSKAVLEATGSILTNKYAEGYPKKRYYQGMENVDAIEAIAIERAKKLFGAEHANVQPYSGSPANAAIFYALLKPGDKIMGLRLDMGGHLTHGHTVNFSSRFYKSCPYVVDKETGMLDMDEIRKLALKEKPNLIISGYTAYPRIIPFKEFHEIALEVGAYSMADISHIAGLIVGGVHPSPLPFTDVVMTTTHKTLRGPRGAIILCKEKFANAIDRAVFPGLQGGPHQHVIAAKAVAFKEAMKPEFKDYAKQIVKNAKVLAETLMDNGIKLVTGGTDNHLILIDLTPIAIGIGRQVAVALENAGICTNMNTIPYDPSTPFKPSGLRIGTPILTTRGMKEEEMKIIGEWISQIINDYKNEKLQKKIKQEVKELCEKFPLFGW
ncbi:MAG: serine hydroxymethyltransferase [Nanoarchaeota archaeon]|nr:serine hydroxymethyltransferase [Nanoarchaeota archaeon]